MIFQSCALKTLNFYGCPFYYNSACGPTDRALEGWLEGPEFKSPSDIVMFYAMNTLNVTYVNST